MTLLRGNSISGKLKTVIMSTSLLSILLATAGFVVYEYATFRQLLVNDLATKAEIIGQNCAAAIVFANAEDAQQTLAALRSQQHIEFAAVYNKEGALFVTYARVQSGPPAAAKPEPDGYRFEQNRLRLFQPIIVNNARVGTLYVESNLDALKDRIVSYGSIALLVVVTCSVVAFLFASRLQKRISHPILALAETSRVVSERQDYSVRAQKISNDELGALADAFNEMLSQIQQREATLQQANAAMAREIAERNKAEKILGASEERFRRLFDSHPLPMWVYDAQSLQFLVVNESAIKEYGYSREEFLEMRITEIRPPEEIPDLLASTQSGRPPLQSSGPWRHRRKDGELVEVEIVSHSTEFEGRPAFLVVAINITERRKAERELKVSEERYRSLVAAMTSIVWTADHEGKFVLPQRSWEKYTGQRWEEHAGLGCMNAIHPDDRDRVRKIWEEASAAKALYESEGRIWHAVSQSYRYFTARAVPLFRADKSVREWIGTVTDVHDRRKAEEEIRKLNLELEERIQQRTAQLEATNKELEAFSYSVSHDLRSPLRSIDGFSQALLEDEADKVSEQGKDYLQRVRAAAQRMAELIDDLINLSRVTRAEMRLEKVNLTDIALSIARELKETQPDRQVEFRIADGIAASGDARLLRVALDNLLGNAWKYTGKHPKARIEFGVTGDNGKSAYFVRDDGAGFDMAYSDKLFGAFQRLHATSEYAGTGIGLATVQRIVRRHGGRIWAEGKVDEGATFYFTLS